MSRRLSDRDRRDPGVRGQRRGDRGLDGPLFDIWIEYRDLVAEVRDHGEGALEAHPPKGDRVLDIGCGLGDTTVRLAELVGPAGHAHGVDVAERMIATAIEEPPVPGSRT